MSGTNRAVPGKLLWNHGLAQTPLAPPPPPNWKPKLIGGTVGGLGVGLAIRVKFVPQPVWKFIVLSLFKNKLVPPTAVAQGELAGIETLVKPSFTEKSPLSPVEKFTEMPRAAPNS